MQLTERVFHFTFKCKFVVQKVTNVLQSKWMKMMKLNGTHVQAVFEKMKVLHYFRFGAEIYGNTFLINFNFINTREASSPFGINFLHLITFLMHKKRRSCFCNVQQCDDIYSEDISAGGGGRLNGSCLGCFQVLNSVLSRPASHVLLAMFYQVHCKILRSASLFFSFL